jgi:hypothetical protein
MIKVLKSFDSAHSAVNWMTQNRIEDTSIETTGTLKSMGVGRIPYGNYHVVLKDATKPPGYQISKQQLGEMLGLGRNQIADFTTLPDRNIEEILSIDPETGQPLTRPHSTIPIGKGGTTDIPAQTVIPAGTGTGYKLAVPGEVMRDKRVRLGKDVPLDGNTSTVRVAPERVITDEPQTNRAPGTAPDGSLLRSISHEDLVNIITKSVMEVLVLKSKTRKLVEAYHSNDPLVHNEAASTVDDLLYEYDRSRPRLEQRMADLTGNQTGGDFEDTVRAAELDKILGKFDISDEEIDTEFDATDEHPSSADITEHLNRAGKNARLNRSKRLDRLARIVLQDKTGVTDHRVDPNFRIPPNF